jgi:hypothetical protein
VLSPSSQTAFLLTLGLHLIFTPPALGSLVPEAPFIIFRTAMHQRSLSAQRTNPTLIHFAIYLSHSWPFGISLVANKKSHQKRDGAVHKRENTLDACHWPGWGGTQRPILASSSSSTFPMEYEAPISTSVRALPGSRLDGSGGG